MLRVEGRGHVMLRARSGILADSGRQASSLWLGGRQDWLAPYAVLHGRVYREHACYQDAPRKGHFDWGRYLVNVTHGLQVVVGCSVMAWENWAFFSAAVNAWAKLKSMCIADYESGNVRDTWQSQAQVTLSAVEGGLSGAVGYETSGLGMIAANAGIGVKFGQLDRALEYHELLFTDYEAWKKVVNDPKAVGLDVLGSVGPDLIAAGGKYINKGVSKKLAEAAGKGVEVSAARDVVDDVFGDVKGSYANGNPVEIGEYINSSGRVYRNADGVSTVQLSGEMPTTAGSSQGVSGVLMDGPHSSVGEPTKAVVGGKSYGGAPDVGNPGRTYSSDLEGGATTTKTATGVQATPSGQTPKASAGGGEGGTGSKGTGEIPEQPSAKGLIGQDFEDYLHKVIGGENKYIKGSNAGREFDGVVGNRWYEAKSGNFWNKLLNDKKMEQKFKTKMVEGLRIAQENGATYELFSNSPIPDIIKEWLTKKGIPFTEILY